MDKPILILAYMMEELATKCHKLAENDQAQREYIERLETALKEECGGRCNAEYNPCWARQLLASKPKDIL